MNQNDSITFTMRLDASDLKKLFPGARTGGAAGGSGGAAGGGGGGGWLANLLGGGGGGGGGSNTGNQGQAKANAKALGRDPSFKSIFKPLATLSIASKTLSGILAQSRIANTYGSAFGKIIGAMLDLLLMPFLPLFNLIMVALTKLMTWLIESGVLDEIQKVVERATGYLEGIAHWIVEVWNAITHLDFSKLAELLIKGLWNLIKTIIKDPAGSLTAAALIPIGGLIGMSILNKLTFGLAGKAAGAVARTGFGMVKSLFGMGGGGAAAEAGAAGAGEAAGAGGGAAAGGAGLLGGLGLGTMALAGGAGLAAGVGTNWLAGKAGMHGAARTTLTGAATGAAAGAVIGSVVPVLGTGIGAAAGGLIGGGIGFAKGMGWFGGGGGDKGGGAAAGGSGNITNSNNTIYFTQNNNFGSGGNANSKAIADLAIAEVERKTGFKLAVRGGH